MNFKKIRNSHLTGIKGVGMTALALYFQDMGIMVSGSDVPEKFVTDEILKKRNIGWSVGINSDHIKKGTELLVTTGAHGGLNNDEVLKAKKLKIPVLTYAEALAEVSYEKETVCVCGVGGKTTIGSMLSVLLDSANLSPSFVVGVGNIFPLNISGRYIKDGRNFVCEADEYVLSPGIDNRPKFSLLKPKIIIATNIEHDHPDVYENIDKTKEVFLQFFKKLPKYGYLIANADNKNTLDVATRSRVNLITYGYEKNVDYRIQGLKFKDQKTLFSIYIRKSKKLIDNIVINVPGKFNAENAAASLVAGDLLGLGHEEIKKGLQRYLGCRRRFEDMGMFFGASFYDDYAHHPGEIKVTIQASKEWFPDRRIAVIFQPHTYSRTKALFDEFSKSFSNADVVGLMDIYSSAREIYDPGVSSELLAKEIRKHQKNCHYLGDHKNTLSWIKENVRSGDVVLTMGAGDIFYLYDLLKNKDLSK